MFDLGDEALQTVLAETISWCATRPIAARLLDSPELRRRRSLIEQGNELRRRTSETRHRFWNRVLKRDHTKMEEWKMADELFHQALQISLPLLKEELRSIDLKPEIALGEARTE